MEIWNDRRRLFTSSSLSLLDMLVFGSFYVITNEESHPLRLQNVRVLFTGLFPGTMKTSP